MTDAELIARQAKYLEELRDKNRDLKERARKAKLHIVCIGGPLNDNKLQFTREQMGTFQRILDALEVDECEDEDI